MRDSHDRSNAVRMTVLVSVARFLQDPRTGGEVYLRQVLDYLQAQGMSWQLVSLVEDLPRACIRNYVLANLIFLWKLLIRGKAEGLILEDFYMHPWLFLFNWLAVLDKRRRVAAFVQLFYHTQQRNAFWNTVDRIVASLFLRPVHLVLANSQGTAHECERLGVRRDRIVVVYPGCDFAGQPISRLPKEFGDDTVRLLAIGNYLPQKGLHHLVEAMALIRERDPVLFRSLRLRIAGDPHDNPSYTQRLTERIRADALQESVQLLGWCGRERVKTLLAQSDIFVFPSLQEGFGMVLAEAMYYGLPIIACRVGPVPELVEDGANGVLVEPGDVTGLAEALIRLAKESDLRLALGRNGETRSRRFVHSWSEVGYRFHQALATLVKETVG